MGEFRGALKRVKRVDLPGGIVVIDTPRESPLMTWSSRWQKAWDWMFDVPLLGDMMRHQERRQIIKSSRGALWFTVIVLGAYASFLFYLGKMIPGISMAAVVAASALLLAWPRLFRSQLEIGPRGWLVRHRSPWGAKQIASGRLQELGSYEIEQLDTRRLQESGAEMADDRVCLYMEHLGGRTMISSGLSSVEAEWVIRQADGVSGRALSGPAAPRALR